MKRGNIPNGASLAAVDKLMEQLQEAIRNGDNAEAAALQAQIDTVRQEAEDARAVGQDARAMVLRRDPRLATLETLAGDLSGAVDAGNDAHARLDRRINEVQLTPGPPGADGNDGEDGQPGRPGNDGTNGQPGTDGNDGQTGADGLSAYQLARASGYGGTQAQWLSSLAGPQGRTGDPGTPADMNRVAALEAQKMQIEYRDGVPVPAITSLLGISASTDVTITWPSPFPDNAYAVTPQVSSTAATLIGKTAVTVKSKTRDACTVTVTSTALLSAGQATLSAVAYRKG